MYIESIIICHCKDNEKKRTINLQVKIKPSIFALAIQKQRLLSLKQRKAT